MVEDTLLAFLSPFHSTFSCLQLWSGCRKILVTSWWSPFTLRARGMWKSRASMQLAVMHDCLRFDHVKKKNRKDGRVKMRSGFRVSGRWLCPHCKWRLFIRCHWWNQRLGEWKAVSGGWWEGTVARTRRDLDIFEELHVCKFTRQHMMFGVGPCHKKI